MIKPEQVPDEAVEVLIAALHGKPGLPYREAIAAALSSWPYKRNLVDGVGRPLRLVLPLVGCPPNRLERT